MSARLAVLVLLTACFEKEPETGPYIKEQTLTLKSSDFVEGGAMPTVLSCEGEDRVPELSWSGVPKGTESFALVIDDPDAPDPMAPKQTWTHWVVYDIPKDTRSLPAGGALPEGAKVAKNSWGKTEYGGPCPPIGRHRYVHKLFALRAPVGDLGDISPEEFQARIAPSVIGRTELIGMYEKAAQ